MYDGFDLYNILDGWESVKRNQGVCIWNKSQRKHARFT